MEAFSGRSDSTDEFTAYLNNANLVDTTNGASVFFVGRSVDDVCKTLTQQYERRLVIYEI